MTDDYAIPDNLVSDHDLLDGNWIERMYPQSEAERAFLAVLLEQEDPGQVMYRLHVESRHFENLHYAAIYDAMTALRDNGVFVDVLSVAENLPASSARDDEVALWALYGAHVYNGQVEFYAEQVMARYRRRAVDGLGVALSEVSRTATQGELEPMVQAQVDAVLNDRAADDFLPDAGSQLAERAFGQRPVESTLATPWPVLNRMIKGFRPGALYVLAGDTGLGKSAIALQCAQAMSNRGTALYASMEMGAAEHYDRLIAQNCAVDLNLVERQFYPEGPVRDKVRDFVTNTRLPIKFEDRANLSVDEIRRVASGVEDLSGITIDYLQLMDLAQRKGENLTDAIGRTTKGLKNLARDLKVPVLLLSQLNREAARSGRPTRHHLLASGAIANDADVILLLFREDPEDESETQVIVDKNRQGPMGFVRLHWQGPFVRAVDASS